MAPGTRLSPGTGLEEEGQPFPATSAGPELKRGPWAKLRRVLLRILGSGTAFHRDGLTLKAPAVPSILQFHRDVGSFPIEQPHPIPGVDLGEDGRGDE